MYTIFININEISLYIAHLMTFRKIHCIKNKYHNKIYYKWIFFFISHLQCHSSLKNVPHIHTKIKNGMHGIRNIELSKYVVCFFPKKSKL